MPPVTRTETYDALLTMTLRNFQRRIHNNISRSNKFYAYMDSRGRIRRTDGGERVQVFLMYGLNSTADIYGGYSDLDTTPQDGFTSSFYEWAQMAVSIAISRLEQRQNSGESRILSLLENKVMQAEASLEELLNNCLVSGRILASADLGQFLPRRGKLDSTKLGPLPLPALVDANPARNVAIGEINGNTEAWWRNHAVDSSATTWAALRREMTNMYNRCSRGIGGSPDLIITDQVAHELYWAGLEGKERYIMNDREKVDVLGGTDVLAFRGAALVWDEVVPDVKTNASIVDGIGTDTLSTMFFLNSEAMEIIVDSQTDFITTDFLTPVGQDASVAEILWMGATAVKNRRKLGVLFGIDRTIAA